MLSVLVLSSALLAAEPETSPVDAPVNEPVSRLTATIIGSLVGAVVTIAAGLASDAFVSALCGWSCSLSTGVHPEQLVVSLAAVIGISPLGPLMGNHVGGGNAPYWRPLVGTLAGLTGAALSTLAFERAGFFRKDAMEIGIGVAVAVLLPLIGQVLATELGADRDPVE